MDRRNRDKPKWQTDIANERIKILFDLAEKEFRENKKYANRYVELARRIGMRYNVKIPKELKSKFCKHCKSYLVPGINSVHRANPKEKAVEILCKECGEKMRFPYRKEKAKLKNLSN